MVSILGLVFLLGCQSPTPPLECTADVDCSGECGGPGAPAGYEELVKKCIENKCVCTSPTGEPWI